MKNSRKTGRPRMPENVERPGGIEPPTFSLGSGQPAKQINTPGEKPVPKSPNEYNPPQADGKTVAALYVETDGCYFGLPNVDPWDEARDAKTYAGPHPVVAHPPCQRWGRFWHGSTRKPHQFKLGDDGGCFAAALDAVVTWGGVIEHPADSHAWKAFDLPIPKRGAGWTDPDGWGGWSCYVEQGNYGHASRKPTWLYACLPSRIGPPMLDWSRCEQRIPQWMIDRYGYAKARRIGVVAMIGGKDKTKKRNATPIAFRDLLLSIAKRAPPMVRYEPALESQDQT